MKQKAIKALDAALSTSLELRKSYLLPPLPILHHTWVQDPSFNAEFMCRGGIFFLEITTGLVCATGGFWKFERFKQSKETLNTALVWLILHELSHFDFGHFKLANEFGVVQRSRQEVHTLDTIRCDLRHLAPLCLEMQADHEATDILLGAYIADDWDELREKVLAISGMMMLIELEDAKNAPEGRTHPKAATRIFQLLGHLAEMPLIQAQVRLDTSLIPSENELQAFSRDVTIPCFFDAVQLAQAAGAVSIANDLGDSEDFFKDLEIAKLGDPSHYGELKTQGAREWAKLWPCNEALKLTLRDHFVD